jgi:hypothetical protein
MPPPSRSVWSLVLLPAILSLLVTIVRLVGELQQWGGTLFSAAGPDPKQQQGLFGISLLIPVFGFVFGFRLRRATGGPPHLGKATLLYLLGAGVLVGGFLLAQSLELIRLPTEAAPGMPQGMPVVLGLLGATTLVLLWAWPRLSATLLLYGLLARLPVVAITFLAVHNGWDTHYDKLPPNMVLPADTDKAMFLSLPQLTFWLVATMLGGGLFGCLGAAITSRKG